jgi:hypothetical protein
VDNENETKSSSWRAFVDYTRHVVSRDLSPLPWCAHTGAIKLGCFLFFAARVVCFRDYKKSFFRNETLFSFQHKPNLIEQYH